MAIARTWSAAEWVERFGPDRKRTAVTIGNFDGVHIGHQAILKRVQTHAHAADQMSAVLTFYPHPAQVLRPSEAPSLLETIEQRIERLGRAGMDAVLVMRFTRELAGLSPQEFAETFLAQTMRAGVVLVGESFRFGHKQTGDVNMLRELGRRLGFAVETVAPVYEEIGGARVVVSSSAIRAAVREGRMEDAQGLLGRAFALAGEIRTGTGTGRKLVVPTLNLATEQETLPKLGVYATETIVADREYRSVTNVGMRPTFDGAKLAIETHLFGFSENLTSGPMTIRFWARIRDEKKFSGPEELKQQILRDIEAARELLETPRSR